MPVRWALAFLLMVLSLTKLFLGWQRIATVPTGVGMMLVRPGL
jgi:hypothetical protein